MEFLALAIWLMLAGTGAALGPFAVTTPGVGLVALGGLGGLAASVLFIVFDAAMWAAWVQVGMAVLGLLGIGLSVAQLTNDQVISGTVAEEIQASIVGLDLFIYFTVLFVTLLIATGGVEPVI
jgi:hypothetical protein